MKIIIWMVVPAIIIYVFWVTYKFFTKDENYFDPLEEDELV